MIMRIVLGLILLILLPGIVVSFLNFGSILIYQTEILIPLGIGAFAGGLIEKFLLRRIPWFETFEHEFTHAIVALLFFRKVDSLVATHSKGGYVSYSGGFGGAIGDDFIGFAPYVLPTFTLILVLIRPLLQPGCFPWYDGAIGISFGFHTYSTIREIRQNWSKRYFQGAGGEMMQTDIGQRGFIYSFIFISGATLAIHGILLTILVSGYGGIPEWGHHIWATTKSCVGIILNQLR